VVNVDKLPINEKTGAPEDFNIKKMKQFIFKMAKKA